MKCDGKELFFLSGTGQLMAVKVEQDAGEFRASKPAELFMTDMVPIGPTYFYNTTAEGRKFVVLKSVDSRSHGLSVTVNWAGMLSPQ